MSLAELRTLITRHVRRDSATAIDGVLLSSVDVPGPPASSTTGTVFALVAQGQKRMSLGDRVLDYGAGQYLLASVDLPVTGHFSVAPALGFGLILRPAAIAALVLEAGLTGSRAAAPGLAVSDASPELIDAVVRMVRLLEQPRDSPVLAPMIEREILWRLITGDQGGTVRQLGLADSGLSHVSRAVQWIRDNHAEPFRVEDLARTAGMSVSAFHRTFLAVTAMSPIQFQKRIRLQQARLLLMGRPSDVAGAGLAVGYDSASQFSRDYRRLFGEPPGRDAARLTAGA
ncbi:AraC family transcriptional regulator [Winogradskya consettensis]|uniref:AraC family transcriptional regulator n=1 Tax=Winogradskya consettensis TaxID=113560 RepID=A0A919T1X4_9ACTN|nr:AraC family transcriptional regulator [Actinoplanes consettensis]GIM81302.1 AraC family transcriptional regulator [Actinoplanes consettensis]